MENAYQIKSTPFVRRIVSASKKNGELQRLKTEYERINQFNERMIELRMRQVRLKRLYRVIEIIKDSTIQRARVKQKSYDQLRGEQILKAKKLGQEFSRLNALKSEENSVRLRPFQDYLLTAQPTEEDVRRRRTKALNYGNTQSRQNIEKLLQSSTRRPLLDEHPSEEERETKRQNLQQRLLYGNSWSQYNLVQAQRARELSNVQLHSLRHMRWLESMTKSDEGSLASDDAHEVLKSCSTPTYCVQMPDQQTVVINEVEKDEDDQGTLCENTEILTERIPVIESQQVQPLKLELKLSQANMDLRQIPVDQQEHELRLIPNATDLPASENGFECSSTCNEDTLLPDEIVINCQRYMDNLFEEQEVAKGFYQPMMRAKQIGTYIKTFEPLDLKSSDKDDISSGAVDKLRRVFEHQ